MGNLTFVSMVAGFLAVLVTIFTIWLTPLWLIIVSIADRLVWPGLFDRYVANRTATPSRAFRFELGTYVISGFCILYLLSFVPHWLEAFRFTAAETTKGLNEAVAVAIVMWLLASFILPALSYLREYYVETPNKKLNSFSYGSLLVWSIAFPAGFAIVFHLGVQYFSPVSLETRGNAPLDNAAANAPSNPSAGGRAAYPGQDILKQSSELTACQQLLKTVPADAQSSVSFFEMNQRFWSYHYLDSISFGALDAFGCNFSAVQHNSDFVFLSVIVFLYKIFVSLFAIGVYYLPARKLIYGLSTQPLVTIGAVAGIALFVPMIISCSITIFTFFSPRVERMAYLSSLLLSVGSLFFTLSSIPPIADSIRLSKRERALGALVGFGVLLIGAGVILENAR